jgi:hypothetical protein
MSILSSTKRKTRNKPPSSALKPERVDPAAFEGFGPVTIAAAYDELTRHAFAVWMRLVVMDDDELNNRKKLAVTLGYCPGRSNQVLRELKRRGYISFIVGGPYQPTEVIIERRPFLESRGKFIRVA